MRISKKQQLKEDLDSMFNILYVAKENFEYCHYMHAPYSRAEIEYLKVDRNLQFIRFSLWQMTIIELDKLVSPTNQVFNFHSLMSKLNPGGHYAHLAPGEHLLALWNGSLAIHGETMVSIKKLKINYMPIQTDYQKRSKLFPSASSM